MSPAAWSSRDDASVVRRSRTVDALYLFEPARDLPVVAFLPPVDRDADLLARVPDFVDAFLLAPVAPNFAAVVRPVVVREPPDFVPPVNFSATFLALFVTVLLAPVIALVTLETVPVLLAMRFLLV